MPRASLRIVERPTFYAEEIQLWANDGEQTCHSLHGALMYPESCRPELSSYFIAKYSRRGDTVLDPFCGSGTTSLEAALAGRIPFATDNNPLALKITQAKLCPVDIGDVTLRLQMLNVRRPTSLENYRALFSPFYDADTFREIQNLREFLAQRYDRIARFIELVTLGLLHGHSAGYLSTYSFPQVALSCAEQERLNLQRRQTPDYRAVVPRILRKTAMTVRDGLPSVLRQVEAQSKLALGDARDLSFVPAGSVDLVVTSPPLPGSHDYIDGMWLRLWFSNLDRQNFGRGRAVYRSVEEWRGFMNEVLLELARVVRGGGRAVLDLREVRIGSDSVCLDEDIVRLVNEDLARYWQPECLLIHHQPSAKIKNSLAEREDVRRKGNRILVLRRH